MLSIAVFISLTAPNPFSLPSTSNILSKTCFGDFSGWYTITAFEIFGSSEFNKPLNTSDASFATFLSLPLYFNTALKPIVGAPFDVPAITLPNSNE